MTSLILQNSKMFMRTTFISLSISFSAIRVLATTITGPSCSVQGVGGVCVTMDNEQQSQACQSIDGFLVFDTVDGKPAGHPGCGTPRNVQLDLITFKTNM